MNRGGFFKRITLAALIIASMPAFVFSKTPNDKQYTKQWYLEQIKAPEAWEEEVGSSQIVIAVLDTGVDLDHPDLSANIWKNIDEIANNGIDDDNNGYVDDVNGWDFVDFDNIPRPDTGASSTDAAVNHGSLIAGIIGARGNNNIGVAGVNWSVKIMPVRMLDAEGSGDSNTARQALDYAVANEADVVNMSFSGNINDPSLRAAVKRAYEAGVVIVSAVGNDSQDTNSYPVYPSCYKSDSADWVIGVASLGVDDAQSDFSNYGSDCVDLSAPGEDIYGVAYNEPTNGYDNVYQGGWYGTSMASPLVAGAAGILLAAYPDLTPEQIRNVLKLSVDPIDLGSVTSQFGAGRLNIENALLLAGQFTGVAQEEVISPESEISSTTSANNYVKAPSFSTVYYITETGRRAFINNSAYFTWIDSFDEISLVDDSDLSNWSLEGLVLPKAGVVLVKIQSEPTVYALAENPDDEFAPKLRAIPDEQTAIVLYGEDWAEYVIDIEPTFFAKFGQDEPMSSSDIVDKSIMKKRVELVAS